MQQAKTCDALENFAEHVGKDGVFSTGANVVNHSGDVYNVKGSTNDPKRVPGNKDVTWRQLLINYGINAPCYVTNSTGPGAAPAGKSHPGFDKGGHMTVNADGSVSNNTCLLMPLCSWHNNTAREDIAFAHTSTAMLQLTGYMQKADIAATFVARLPSIEPLALIYPTASGFGATKLLAEEAEDFSRMNLRGLTAGTGPEQYVLLERMLRKGKETYVLREARI